jgi:hypothetical protein
LTPLPCGFTTSHRHYLRVLTDSLAPATPDSRVIPIREETAVTATIQITDVAALPLAPKNPLPYWQLLHAFRVSTPDKKLSATRADA